MKLRQACRMMVAVAVIMASTAVGQDAKQIKVGIIGLDTSHAPAFAGFMNDPKSTGDVALCKVVAAYPKGSPDIESSTSRVPQYTEQLRKMGIEIVPSIDELVKKVDCVLLETNDGRPHLRQLVPALRAGKRTFIDKPVAGNLADALAIYHLANKYKTPVFSSSSLRYAPGAQQLRSGELGKVVGCDAYSPCHLEKTHPDLFWYGIHGVETLFTVMGPGCKTVTRVNSPGADLVVGKWADGRIGTFRGVRGVSSGYGGTAFTTKGTKAIGKYGGYKPLVIEIAKFFRTGKPPVDPRETLEIYAFMEAADESKRQGGKSVAVSAVIKKSLEAARKRIEEVDSK